MKKRFIFAVAVVMVLSLLTGCGDALYRMTPEEERMIADYSGKIVAKYNKFQGDGICRISSKRLAELDEAEAVYDEPLADELPEDISDEPSEDTADDAQEDTAAEVTQPDFDDMETTAVIEEGTGIMPVNPGAPVTRITPQAPAVSIGDTIGYPQLDITVDEIFTVDEYKEGSYFIMTPSAGNRYIVLYISMENPSGSDVTCNVLETGAKFVATMGDGTTASSVNAFIADDFGQFQGKIGNGVIVSAVSLIEVPAALTEDLYGMKIRLETTDGAYTDIY